MNLREPGGGLRSLLGLKQMGRTGPVSNTGPGKVEGSVKVFVGVIAEKGRADPCGLTPVCVWEVTLRSTKGGQVWRGSVISFLLPKTASSFFGGGGDHVSWAESSPSGGIAPKNLWVAQCSFGVLVHDHAMLTHFSPAQGPLPTRQPHMRPAGGTTTPSEGRADT